ncbi:EamA family transporter [Candidatus Daviesbacteria bacterium]|nr:EamA family transporter [Candidatus Daviesbacteria bacterium]
MRSGILSKPIPYIALILAHLIWGANFVVAKVTLQEFPPMTLAFLRFSLASLFLAPFFLAETKKVKVDKSDYPKLVAIGILIITLNIAFFFEGIKKTTAINASVLTLIIPMLSVLLGWWFLKEKIYLVNLLGIFVGLIGAVIIIGLPEILVGEFLPQAMLGNVLVLLAATFWVIGAVIARGMLKKYSSLVITAIAFMTGTVTFIIPALSEYFKNPAFISQITILGLLGLTYMTLLSSISAYFLFEWGLAKVGVIKADLLQYIEPFVAAGLAVLILGEQITIPLIVGAILIIAGVYLGTLSQKPHHRHHKAHRI